MFFLLLGRVTNSGAVAFVQTKTERCLFTLAIENAMMGFQSFFFVCRELIFDPVKWLFDGYVLHNIIGLSCMESFMTTTK